jgi:DNA repair protein RAD16
MRLAANHPDLVTTKLALEANAAKEFHICAICHEEAESPIQAKCKHVFCREDVRQYIQSSPDTKIGCPICFKPLVIDLTQPELEAPTSATATRKSIVNYIDLPNWRSSTKIEALGNLI